MNRFIEYAHDLERVIDSFGYPTYIKDVMPKATAKQFILMIARRHGELIPGSKKHAKGVPSWGGLKGEYAEVRSHRDVDISGLHPNLIEPAHIERDLSWLDIQTGGYKALMSRKDPMLVKIHGPLLLDNDPHLALFAAHAVQDRDLMQRVVQRGVRGNQPIEQISGLMAAVLTDDNEGRTEIWRKIEAADVSATAYFHLCPGLTQFGSEECPPLPQPHGDPSLTFLHQIRSIASDGYPDNSRRYMTQSSPEDDARWERVLRSRRVDENGEIDKEEMAAARADFIQHASQQQLFEMGDEIEDAGLLARAFPGIMAEDARTQGYGMLLDYMLRFAVDTKHKGRIRSVRDAAADGGYFSLAVKASYALGDKNPGSQFLDDVRLDPQGYLWEVLNDYEEPWIAQQCVRLALDEGVYDLDLYGEHVYQAAYVSGDTLLMGEVVDRLMEEAPRSLYASHRAPDIDNPGYSDPIAGRLPLLLHSWLQQDVFPTDIEAIHDLMGEVPYEELKERARKKLAEVDPQKSFKHTRFESYMPVRLREDPDHDLMRECLDVYIERNDLAHLRNDIMAMYVPASAREPAL